MHIQPPGLVAARRLARIAWNRLFYAMGEWRNLRGIRVGLFLVDEDPPVAAACFEKVEMALQLIATHAPRRFARFQRDVRQVWICPLGGNSVGRLSPVDGTCEVDQSWVSADSTSATEVAGTIVHEAMHARITRRGVKDSSSDRCERACWRAELAFARRLPGEEERVASLLQVLKSGEFRTSQEEALEDTRRAILEALRAGKLPAWLLRRIGAWLEPSRRQNR